MRGVSLLTSLAAVCAALALAASSGAHTVKEGGTFRIGLSGIFDFIDPALANHQNSWALLDTSCATLMRYPDKPAPQGYKLAPEVAKSSPRASNDLKTWTFTLRSGFRFSDGTPVQAAAFARAIHRTLDPAIESPGAQYTQAIVGARDVLAGKAAAASGVVARGNTLTVRFTKPVPDFPAQTTMPYFCAVPPGLPVDPEGIGAFPGSGPYYVKEFRPGERLVIERNPYYRGSRPHHVDGFLVDLRSSTADQTLDAVEDGTLDWGFAGRNAPFNPSRGLVRKYGVNRSQFFVAPSTIQRGWAMNTSRPLFRDNIALRQAVNFALDRSAFSGGVRGRLTDQYQLPAMPGFEDARIYPLQRPDLPRAKSLARGHLRGGKANLYIIDVPELVMFARLAKTQLAAIGLDVRITTVPASAWNATITRRGTPWDILLDQLSAGYLDPSVYLQTMFGLPYYAGNFWWLDEPEVRLALRAASRLQGAARARAYGQLDVKLARDYAPLAAIDFANEPTLVSKRVGCVVVKPTLDLTAVCLK